jgi:serine/threonine-protein kinase
LPVEIAGVGEEGAVALLGKRLGVYELEEEIGRGAMGIVYRGRQVTLDRVVAVKVLLENLASDESFVARFIREARLVASLNHPNIVHVYDAGRAENLLYFAMEYIAGPTVGQLLKQKGRLPVAQAVDVAIQVAAALDYAYAEVQLIHRDIKPENMILDRWGKVKVVDFGLARVAGGNTITRVGTVVGSLYYVSPEQLLGRKLDGRADVYALGVALYEMLTGQRPFLGKNLGELSHAILLGPLTPPSSLESSIPAALEAALLKAMERDREQRYSSAGEFEAALRQCMIAAPSPERKALPHQSITLPALKPELRPERKLAAQQGAAAPAPIPDPQQERQVAYQQMPATPLPTVEPRPERRPTPPQPTGASTAPAESKPEPKKVPPQPTASPPAPPGARPWQLSGRPRPDPSLPAITLRPLPQPPAHPAEPPAATPSERPAPQQPIQPPKTTGNLPAAPAEPPAEADVPTPTDLTAADLLKTAATQLQRLVSRLKKE